jgi:hypothetical protein
MTVSQLFEVLDKSIMINVFEAGNNELLFDSSKWHEKNYTRKGWEHVKDREVLQITPDGNGKELLIFIAVENPIVDN